MNRFDCIFDEEKRMAPKISNPIDGIKPGHYWYIDRPDLYGNNARLKIESITGKHVRFTWISGKHFNANRSNDSCGIEFFNGDTAIYIGQ